MNKITAILLSLFILTGSLFTVPLTAYAADVKVDIVNVPGWTRATVHNLWNGGHIEPFAFPVISTGGNLLYCIEPGADLHTGNEMNLNNYVDNITTPSIHEAFAVTKLLGRLFQYVDYSGSGMPISTTAGTAQYVAAQLLVWETVQGERDADFGYVSPPSGFGSVTDTITNSANISQDKKDQVFAYYNSFVNSVKAHTRIPSFSRYSTATAPTYELADTTGTFSLALTDSNNVLSRYSFSASGVSFSASGNTLAVTAAEPFTGTLAVNVQSRSIQRRGILCYGDGAGSIQDTMSIGSPIDDPVRGFFNIKIAMGRITIDKGDSETASRAQGDATLAGAVFDIFDKHGAQVQRLYCGSSVSATSKDIPVSSYTVKEAMPPTGYLLSETVYQAKIPYAGQEAGISLLSVNMFNQVVKGRVNLVKHSDEPDPSAGENEQVERPLKGIVFEVYLKAAGSYENAAASERDRLTTDERGYAGTKPLPYGTYTVKEVSGADEKKMADPFDVFIKEDSRTYYYIVSNPAYRGKVKIVKTDAETGQAIPLPGTSFKVKNADTGEWVVQEILYPAPIKIDTYLTAGDGTLVMPQELPYGNYEVLEVGAPYGYLLSGEPVPFKITSENPAEYFEVVMKNAPVKGKVAVEKTGEALSGADAMDSDFGKVYVPRYMERGIAGAVFDIVAAGDIATLDGTVRRKAGSTVDTIVTDERGRAESRELYLGNYEAVEREVPYGFILDSAPLPFSLVYEDQYTALVSSEAGLFNDRAKGEISLIKTRETVDAFTGKGVTYIQAPAKDIVFGLYAREDICGADGDTVIPKDSLLDVIFTDDGGEASTTCDIPFGKYYVKELKTHADLVLPDTEYEAAFEYAGVETPLVQIMLNEGNPIENLMVKARIKIIKTNEEKKPLCGAEFLLTQEAYGVGLILVTDENGEAMTDFLPYGRYEIKETMAPKPYLLDTHTHTLLLSKDGEVYELGLVNMLKPVSAATPAPEKPIAHVPKTGDDTHVGFYIGLIAAAAGGIIAVIIVRRKNRLGGDE
jgi:hypothetical protein